MSFILFRKYWVLFLICIYKIVLDYSYFELVSNAFQYMGFVDCRNMDSLLLSYTFFLCSLPIAWHFFKSERTSALILFFIYLMAYVPFTTSVYASFLSFECIFWNIIYWSVLFFLYCFFNGDGGQKIFRIRVDGKIVNKILVAALSCIFVFVIIYISGSYTGFRLHFNLYNVYGIRAEAGSYNFPSYINYIYSMSRVFLPLYFGYCIIKKNYMLAVLIWMVQILSFGIAGLKSSFFMPFIVLFVTLICSKMGKKEIKIYSVIGIITIILFGIIETDCFRTIYITDFFIRRILFVPELLHEYYWVFFNLHEPDYLQGSFLRHFGYVSQYTASGGIANAVGAYFLNPDTHANNGLFSEAVANFGVWGSIVFPFVLVIVFRVFDYCGYGKDERLVAILSFHTAYVLISSPIGTTLFGHGVLISMIFLSLLDKKQLDLKRWNY